MKSSTPPEIEYAQSVADARMAATKAQAES